MKRKIDILYSIVALVLFFTVTANVFYPFLPDIIIFTFIMPYTLLMSYRTWKETHKKIDLFCSVLCLAVVAAILLYWIKEVFVHFI